MTLRSVNFLYELNHTSQYICSNSRSSNALHWVEFAGTVTFWFPTLTVVLSNSYFTTKSPFTQSQWQFFLTYICQLFFFTGNFLLEKKKTCILNVIVRNKYALCYIKLYVLKNLAGSTRMIVNPNDIYRS